MIWKTKKAKSHSLFAFFCENHEGRGRRGRKKRSKEEKGLRLFPHCNHPLVLFSLSLRTPKVSRPSHDFHVGVAAEMPWWFFADL
jgi:hypothetical protein